LEADRHLIDRLEEFLGAPRGDEWPGLIFNIAFGTQGQLRYCQVPALMEMLGLPYLGSGPWGHALASDKAATKALLSQHGLPTPEFAVCYSADEPDPGLEYPLVVKPLAEASSLGVHLVHDPGQMRDAVAENLARFRQPIMLERFVGGREFNVSIIGNGREAQSLPPVEVRLGDAGVPIYSTDDKHGIAGRKLDLLVPAPVSASLAERLLHLAREAFTVLQCRDWARIEFREDSEGRLYVLEVNTQPGLGTIASLPAAARVAGMKDLPAILKRLVEVAVERYEQDARYEHEQASA
jgi:D-alanine-D-alanine ligase